MLAIELRHLSRGTRGLWCGGRIRSGATWHLQRMWRVADGLMDGFIDACIDANCDAKLRSAEANKALQVLIILSSLVLSSLSFLLQQYYYSSTQYYLLVLVLQY